MNNSLSHHKPILAGNIGIDQDQLPDFDAGPIDLNAWFSPLDDPKPLDLEIGSGKGTFLVQHTPLTPDVNYIGIEYAAAIWRYAADRCRRHCLCNVKIVHTEAGSFVRHFVPPGCLRQVHVYFPDPWPKKRHHKRRLIQDAFLRQLHNCLEPGGLVRIATDHQGYFQWIQEHALLVEDLYEQQPFQALSSAQEGELVGTNFERKYRLEGKPFYAMILRRR